MFNYYSYSKLDSFTKNYRSRNIVKEVQLNVLERIQSNKQSLSNLDTNNKQANIDSNLEKNQTLESIQDIKKSKEESDFEREKINLKEETNL